MTQPSILIWGAGKIGRGFIADLFHSAGYRLVLVDQSAELVASLRQEGRYTVVHQFNAEQREDVSISDFSALTTLDTDELQRAVCNTDLIALAVFPQVFEEAAEQMIPLILKRQEERTGAPLDILLCTNLVQAAQAFRSALEKFCPLEKVENLRTQLGVVETLIIRINPEAPRELREKEPLLIFTNGYPTLPLEKHALRTSLPELPFLRLVDDMHAEEMRKMYTYNMLQAVLAYHGARRGFPLLVNCFANPKVKSEAEGALSEASQALQAEYGFNADEMAEWNQSVLEQIDNRTLGDTVKRMATDPLRKLRRVDRLVGPALLALKHGIQPRFLVRAIAAAFLYQDKDDPSASMLQERIQAGGLRETIEEVSSLTSDDNELVDKILRATLRLPLELNWEKKAFQAFALGFDYEKVYHGCGQCVYAAIANVLDNFDPSIFNAATALSGGLALYGKATCSALTGAALAIGDIYPRHYEHFDGDRANKYRNFTMVQKLMDKFNERYGSLICHDIHTVRMGRAFDLRDKAEREAFEKAGAHDNQCTEMSGLATQWAIEIIGEEMIEDELRWKKV